MIRLTDEENPYVTKDGSHLLPGEDKYCYQAFNEGAKVQLKKVVEWLELNSTYDESLRDSNDGYVHIRGEI